MAHWKKPNGIVNTYLYFINISSNNKMKQHFLSLAAVVLVSSAMFVSCGETKPAEGKTEETSATAVTDTAKQEEPFVMVGGAKMVPSLDIVDNALNANNVTTLVAAVKAAGLVETLKGAGPFTVFAPTDSAFGKLPKGTVESLVKPENKAKLTSILTYHVVAGALTADSLKNDQMLKTVNGKELKVTIKDGVVMINGAKVIIPNVISKNGVTHVVDQVIIPAGK